MSSRSGSWYRHSPKTMQEGESGALKLGKSQSFYINEKAHPNCKSWGKK